jgi:hypothetical protein
MTGRWVVVEASWFDEHPNDALPVGLMLDPVSRCVWVDPSRRGGVGSEVLVEDGVALAVRVHRSAA